MNVCNDFGWQRLNQQYVFFILIAFYIRKNISSTFLKPDEIIKNQGMINRQCDSLSSEELRYIMPYYDYMISYLGIDRSNIPQEISQIYRDGSHIPEFSWAFNEIISYSLGQPFVYNDLRRFYGQFTVVPDTCKELCRLIILYGGEQEHARDEK